MTLLQSLGLSDTTPVIEGNGIFLRIPRMADFEAWSSLRGASREFLAPWEPLWPADDLTKAAFRRRIRRYGHELYEQSGYAFFVFRKTDQALVGGATLTNLRRGAAQAGSLGYWMGQSFSRKGYMSAAIAALVPFAHSALRLRRIEAACLSGNAASIRLLEKMNFAREGVARQYLSIAGSWQDHLLYARLASDPLPVAVPPKD